MELAAPLSLKKAAFALAAGRVRAEDAVRSALERAASTEDSIHAWVVIDAERALAQAKRLDGLPPHERGPLHGVPVGVKDIIDVAGLPTRCGSVLRGSTPAAADAAIVGRLRSMGAVVMGKTVTTEFAYFSPGPTANPRDTSRTPGGSSSGSAAAVTAGVVPLALGTQTAASVARPAAYCGIAGFVAARGEFPDQGITGLSHSLDSVGFLAASVGDLAFLRRSLVGSPRALHHVSTPEAGPAGPAVVVSWAPGREFRVEPEMLSALARAEAVLESLGHCVERLDLDGRAESLAEAHTTVMAYEAVRLRAAEAVRPDSISGPLADLFAAGRGTSDAAYAAARSHIEEQRHWIRERLAGGRLLLAPAAQGPAPVGLASTGLPIMSRPWQALGLPVLVVPGSEDLGTGMPLGLQLACLPGMEDVLFAAGKAMEQGISAAGAHPCPRRSCRPRPVDLQLRNVGPGPSW
ncbi:hypothetical protein SA2016_3794 [Sinomonas atrocyanea]|uniref:Amidase domain-containing protein n=1 Tax=Sinomonas atrocyanea TaxID=37927 RepID=A0A127A696_9MICC|nr:amidase [Sinomonas atrocyanea]AMM34451.1 hypothetical protein SA2016_3794 [Sinomonas atrocyanea]GEB65825.1 amidase [Sinomonas atrocyanea]GGG61158.1 amidase [Sinomonas atrocyanea]